MPMMTKKVQVSSALGGEAVAGELLLCPDCKATSFHVFTPQGVGHVHFQCSFCGTSFCDGCHEDEGEIFRQGRVEVRDAT